MAGEGTVPAPGHTMVFDGDCGFCTMSVRWLFAHVRPVGVDAIRYQSFDLAAHGLTAQRARFEVLWVPAAGGDPAGGAAAISRLLSAAERPWWRLAGRLLRTPPVSWLAGVVYRRVARNRQRMPGGTDACAIRITGPE